MKKLFKVFLVMGIVMAELCFAAAIEYRSPTFAGVGGPSEPIQEGGTAMFFANVIAYPEAGGIWYRNDVIITPSSRIFIGSLNGIYKLTINDLYPEDSGEYKLVVANPAGSNSRSFSLIVN